MGCKNRGEIRLYLKQYGVLQGEVDVTSVAFAAGLPLLDKSHKSLQRIARAVPEAKRSQVGMIVHPPGQHLGERPPNRPREYDDVTTFSGSLLYQLSVEHLQSWGIDPNAMTAEDAAVAIGQRQTQEGFVAVADTNHLAMERKGERIEPGKAEELARCMGRRGLLDEVQLGIQPDFGAGANAVKTLLEEGLEATPQGRIFTAAVSEWPRDKPLVATVETPYSAVKPHGGYTALEQIVTQVRGVISGRG